MPTPDDVLNFFVRNDGLGENPSNTNWITNWYGLNDAWCAMAVSRACLESGFAAPDNDKVIVPGIALDTIHGWQYVPSMVKKFLDAGALTDVPFRGAVGFIVYPSSGDWRDSTYGTPGDHVDIVESWTDSTVTTWDGNVSNRIGKNTWPRSYFYAFGKLPYTQSQEVVDMNQRVEDALVSMSDLANKFFRGVSDIDDAYNGAETFGKFVGEAIRSWGSRNG